MSYQRLACMVLRVCGELPMCQRHGVTGVCGGVAGLAWGGMGWGGVGRGGAGWRGVGWGRLAWGWLAAQSACGDVPTLKCMG